MKMEKPMTEYEYKTRNAIAFTYIMQFLSAVLALTAAYLIWRSMTGHPSGSVTLQKILLAVNVGLFLFQFHHRKKLLARL
jgi:hypothetical protein